MKASMFLKDIPSEENGFSSQHPKFNVIQLKTSENRQFSCQALIVFEDIEKL